VTLASLLSINFFTKNPYKGNLKTILNKVNNKEMRRTDLYSGNYSIGKLNLSDACNMLSDSNISHHDYFENKEYVNKIIPVLIFLMFR